MKPKNLLWILPFLLFFSGYILMSFLTQVPELETPALIGKQLNQAVYTLSQLNLNARILTEKEDLELQEGTILSQTPNSGSKIKPNQSVFLVITKKPNKEKVPNFTGLKESEIEEISSSKQIKTKIYKIAGNYPNDTVIGQSPEPDSNFSDPKNKTVFLYVCNNNKDLRIFPDLKGININDIKIFLNENNLKCEIIHTYYIEPSHKCQNCVAKDQRPLAGSLINPDKSFTVYINAQEV